VRRFCSPRNNSSIMFTGEDGAAAATIGDGGGSGGAPADSGAAPGDVADMNLRQENTP
jgi:hypothetical protein